MSSRVIEEGYWRHPLDFTVCTTSYGQFFEYFDQHVSPRHLTTRSEGSFHQYSELPAELQLRVLQQCDAPTLFQLMHTTRCLRVESRKLFFSDWTTWYRLEMDDLLQSQLLSDSIYEPSFLANIEQLDIHCACLNSRDLSPDVTEMTFDSDEERSRFVNEQTESYLKNFWCTVQRFCPLAKRVMFTRDGRSFPDKDVMTDCFLKIVQFCPQGLDVFFHTTETAEEAVGRRRKRVLWLLRTGNRNMITETEPRREKHRKAPVKIVIPPQKPHRGRVGEFIKARTLFFRTAGQRFAAEYHRAAAVEQHYFLGRYKPFGCTVTDCDAWFDQPEQYTTHLLGTGHGKGDTAHGQVEVLVTKNKQRLDHLTQEVHQAHRRFWDWWGQWDTEQRNMAENHVMDQLEHDPLYAGDKPVAEHKLLAEIYYLEGQNEL
ncbi:hypothetical protein C7974DRAFT_384588 [Boeremia exigua]|uniref:uncharacterized protein n=1 Tax=Boeremia exigua TaxID=749465 RepID=UPI001E8E4B3D|nr:uncharacterized protein C7974DRAFT_384588 [Boeremia exigua]KAH6641966.1 hypothetical protein C7974DRAFT_384588 [Boeremia exigua]